MCYGIIGIFHRPSRFSPASFSSSLSQVFQTTPHILFKMLFRAAAIFTTLACAVSSFAAPLGPDTSAVTGVLSSLTGSVPAVGARQLPPLTGLFGNSNPAGIVDGIAPRAQASAAAALVTRGDDHPTIPDAFQGACDQLVDITVKLRMLLFFGRFVRLVL